MIQCLNHRGAELSLGNDVKYHTVLMQRTEFLLICTSGHQQQIC